MQLPRVSHVAKLEFETPRVVELVRIHKVQQSPQLLNVVLNRGAGENDLVLDFHGLQHFREFCLAVLETVTFVHNAHLHE